MKGNLGYRVVQRLALVPYSKTALLMKFQFGDFENIEIVLWPHESKTEESGLEWHYVWSRLLPGIGGSPICFTVL